MEARELIQAYDLILKEYDELRGTNEYKKHFEKLDGTLWDLYLIDAIKLTESCLKIVDTKNGKFNTTLASQLIDEFNIRHNGKKVEIEEKGLNKKAISTLEMVRKGIENKILIRNEKEKAKEKTIQLWEDARVYIQIILGILPEYDCSVTQFISYEKSAKATITAKEKHKANGR